VLQVIFSPLKRRPFIASSEKRSRLLSPMFFFLLGIGPFASSSSCQRCPSPKERAALLRKEPCAPITLRLLSYNVLVDPIFIETRIPALLNVLREAQADVIALQEVAPWFYRILMAQAWARAYNHTAYDPRASGGQFILSRLPLRKSSLYVLPGRQLRTAVFAQISLDNQVVAVGTTHLESLLEDGAVRARQLEELFSLADRHSSAILMGDFNFGDKEEPETSHLDKRYRDLWRELKRGDPGYTWDIERSEMARQGSFPDEPSRRLDRVLFRVDGFIPKSVKLVGDRPVPPSIFPSDHFGVLGEIERPCRHES
jgi:endonuclease/exonuclease/phosphatase family metal-dependent hydrolase